MGHPYDTIKFDFSKTSDKLPHQCAIEAPASFDIRGKALKWFKIFLSSRTHLVKVNNNLSEVYM